MTDPEINSDEGDSVEPLQLGHLSGAKLRWEEPDGTEHIVQFGE